MPQLYRQVKYNITRPQFIDNIFKTSTKIMKPLEQKFTQVLLIIFESLSNI